MSLCAWPFDPQNNDEDEKAGDVKKNGQSFQYGKPVDAEGIEADRCQNESHGEQHAVPALDHIRRVANGNQTHDLLSADICHRGHTRLPAKSAKSSYEI